jgi:5-hydroxyisourate hydrolase
MTGRMNAITTHVLDAVLGKPAAGITVRLEKRERFLWNVISSGVTDVDGRCRDLAPEAKKGVYRLTFETRAYLARNGRESIYPEISITFICSGKEHYHLPLLLSDNSYTTYRGS